MENIQIIETLKDNYNRDLRKQVVKTIISNEKESKNPDYKIINQIFSYVLKELKWYEEQILTAKKIIELKMKG